MTITDHNISVSLHNITRVTATKCTYDTFKAYDLNIEGDDGQIIRITLFGADANDIAFEDGDIKDSRTK